MKIASVYLEFWNRPVAGNGLSLFRVLLFPALAWTSEELLIRIGAWRVEHGIFLSDLERMGLPSLRLTDTPASLAFLSAHLVLVGLFLLASFGLCVGFRSRLCAGSCLVILAYFIQLDISFSEFSFKLLAALLLAASIAPVGRILRSWEIGLFIAPIWLSCATLAFRQFGMTEGGAGILENAPSAVFVVAPILLLLPRVFRLIGILSLEAILVLGPDGFFPPGVRWILIPGMTLFLAPKWPRFRGSN